MAKPKCVPLKITAHLLDGRINSADGVIMFDSILYHAWFQKYHPEVFLDQLEDEFDGYIGLPLRQLPGNRWEASRGVYEEIGQAIEHYNKRPDFFASDKIGHLANDKGLISDSVGAYRAYRNPQLIRTVKDGKIVFYAVGHKNEIEELLSYITAVGKKPAMGWGIVEKWEVEEIPENYSTWHPEFGLMRPIEFDKSGEIAELSDYKEKYPVMMYGIKPPYWKHKNLRVCYVPIGSVER